MLNNIKKTINLILRDKITNALPLAELKDKTVIISGASKGIGKATAEYLHEQGCNLILLSRKIEELKNIFPQEKFSTVKLYELDISNFEKTKQTINSILNQNINIDVLINNAGVNIEKPLEESTNEDINKIIDTNIKGAINLSANLIPHFKKNKSGTIINIGSKISHNTNVGANKVLYATSKYAIEGFSFALNKELKGTGVRSICLMPGTVNTFVSTNAGDFMSPDRVAQVIGMIIKFDDLDFEGLVFKSKEQTI